MNTMMRAMAEFAGSLRELRALMRTDDLIGDAHEAYSKLKGLETEVLEMLETFEKLWRMAYLSRSEAKADSLAKAMAANIAEAEAIIAPARDDLFGNPGRTTLAKLGEAADRAHALLLSILTRVLSGVAAKVVLGGASGRAKTKKEKDHDQI